jgi:hypothetical protein
MMVLALSLAFGMLYAQDAMHRSTDRDLTRSTETQSRSLTTTTLLQTNFSSPTFPPDGWDVQPANPNIWHRWHRANPSGTNPINAAGSSSYFNEEPYGAFTPNHWLITPQITIPATGEINLDFAYAGNEYDLERIGIYVSTTGTTIGTDTSTDIGSVVGDFTLIWTELADDWGWVDEKLSLDAYRGQTIYIAFRHWDSYDGFYLLLTDVVLTRIDHGPEGNITGVVTDDGTPMAGVEVSAVGFWSHTATTDATGAYSLVGVPKSADIRASIFGYANNTVLSNQIVWDASDNAVVNFAMETLGAASINGNVVLFDTGQNAVGATVSLVGFETQFPPVTTNAQGDFGFNSVPVGEYTIRVNYPGYQVNNTDIDHQSTTFIEIELIELLLSVSHVTAILDTAPTTESGLPNVNVGNVEVSWNNPYYRDVEFSHAISPPSAILGMNQAGSTWSIGHRYTQEQLEDFGVVGLDLYGLAYTPRFTQDTYTFMVFLLDEGQTPQGNIPDAVKVMENYQTGTWHDEFLDIPVTITPGKELWLVVEIFQFDAAVGVSPFPGYSGWGDSGPINQFFGDMIRYGTNQSWRSLRTEHATWNANWNIVGLAAGTVGANPTALRFSKSDKPTTTYIPPAVDLTCVGPLHTASFDTHLQAYPIHASLKESNRAFNFTYNVYRMPESITNPALFGAPIAEGLVHDPTTASGGLRQYFRDTSFSLIPTAGPYHYAVTARYHRIVGGNQVVYAESAPAFSGTVNKLNTGSVAITVARADGGSVAGATISMRVAQGVSVSAPTYNHTLTGANTTFTTAGTVRLNVPYDLTVNLDGYGEYLAIHRFSAPQNAIHLTLHPVNTVMTVDFADWPMSGWTVLDVDADGHTWRAGGANEDGRRAGNTPAVSQSHHSGTKLYPNNWLISPVINLPTTTDAILLDYWVAANHPSATAEKLFVYMTTNISTPPTVDDFLDTYESSNGGNWENELLANNAELLNVIEIEPNDNAWKRQFSDKLSDYAGQPVRLAFRHAHCADGFMIRLDEVKVYSTPITRVNVSGLIKDSVTGLAVQNAIITITGSMFSDNVATDATGAFTMSNVPTRGSYTIRINADTYYPIERTFAVASANLTFPNPFFIQPGYVSEDDETMIPTRVTTLKPNYPNPFNPSTTIAFDMATSGRVSIEIYNIKGQKVRTLVNGYITSGEHTVVWNGNDDAGRPTASGVYFYRMQTESFSSIRKMLLMK